MTTPVPIDVTVDNASDTNPPCVALTAPTANATVSGTTTVTATSADDVGVAGVQFKVDGGNLGAEDTSSPYSASWTTTSFANGTHTVTATARDAVGNVKTSAPVTVTVSNQGVPTDTTKPTVTLTAPANGSTVSGSTTVSATASDNVGVVGVQFKVDSTNLGSEDTSPSYSAPWTTTSLSNGTHTVTATARDAAGNTATSTVTVTVSNTSTPPATEIVIHAIDVPATSIVGNWAKVTDSTAADGVAIWNKDKAAAKIVPAQTAPANYFEVTFNAPAGTPYHLWIRMRAESNSWSNDSIHVQFSDSVDSPSATAARSTVLDPPGRTTPHKSSCRNPDAGTVSNWGWADQGWNGLGDAIYFKTSGLHTLRIQQREDGPVIDQIVLSPNLYFSIAPGKQKDDTTIVSK